eukprot:744898-Pelagomonas_calceolata.AAC.10
MQQQKNCLLLKYLLPHTDILFKHYLSFVYKKLLAGVCGHPTCKRLKRLISYACSCAREEMTVAGSCTGSPTKYNCVQARTHGLEKENMQIDQTEIKAETFSGRNKDHGVTGGQHGGRLDCLSSLVNYDHIKPGCRHSMEHQIQMGIEASTKIHVWTLKDLNY